MEDIEKNYRNLLISIAKNLKTARVQQKIRQAEMIRFGFSERYVQKIESGQYSPNLFTLFRFSEAYGLPMEDIFKKSGAAP